MINDNPIKEAIYKNIVRPAINQKIADVDGTILTVDYYSHTADVSWRHPVSGSIYTSKDLPLPQNGSGVYVSSVQANDPVKLSFRGGNDSDPYIVTCYKKGGINADDYISEYGNRLPKGISFF